MTIIKKFEPVEERKFPRLYVFFVGITFLTLLVIEIWVSNTVVTYGDKFKKLSVLENTLKMENQILKNEIAKQTSLNSIATKSSELGFERVESIQYIR